MSKAKVKIMIPGTRYREVYIEENESLYGLLKRIHMDGFPLLDVHQWYRNAEPVADWSLPPCDGDLYAGTQTIGGNAVVNVMAYSASLPSTFFHRLSFMKGMTLKQALDASSSPARDWSDEALGWEYKLPSGAGGFVDDARKMALVQGMLILPHHVSVLLLGHGAVRTFPLQRGQTVDFFLKKNTSDGFPMDDALTVYARATMSCEVASRVIDNPSTSRLHPGAHLVLDTQAGVKVPYTAVKLDYKKFRDEGLARIQRLQLQILAAKTKVKPDCPPPMITLNLFGRDIPFRFEPGETLSDLLARLSPHCQDRAAQVRSWRWRCPESVGGRLEAILVKLQDGMKITGVV